jgi:hypothetical protein
MRPFCAIAWRRLTHVSHLASMSITSSAFAWIRHSTICIVHLFPIRAKQKCRPARVSGHWAARPRVVLLLPPLLVLTAFSLRFQKFPSRSLGMLQPLCQSGPQPVRAFGAFTRRHQGALASIQRGADFSAGRASIATNIRYTFGFLRQGFQRRPMPDALPTRQHTP